MNGHNHTEHEKRNASGGCSKDQEDKFFKGNKINKRGKDMEKATTKKITAKEYSDLILSKVREVLNGESFKEFLLSPDTLQAFRHEVLNLEDYSFCNRLTLALFRARAVAGFKTWLNLGFCVKKGARGIPIYKPLRVVVKSEGQGKEEAEAEGQDTRQAPAMRFSVAYVFDVSQVQELAGEENAKKREKALDFFKSRERRSFCRELTGGNEAMAGGVRAWINQTYPIRLENIFGGPKGRTDGQSITIKEGMDPAQGIKTMLHENVHCRLGHVGSDLSRETAEIQAETAAFIAADRLGLDTGPYSFDYLAGWGHQILEAQNGAVQFRNILQAAIEEGNKMAEEFKAFQEQNRSGEMVSDFALCA